MILNLNTKVQCKLDLKYGKCVHLYKRFSLYSYKKTKTSEFVEMGKMLQNFMIAIDKIPLNSTLCVVCFGEINIFSLQATIARYQ